jgi:hypothetical protein
MARDYDIEDWAETFKPITNHLDANASWDGIMFETYGDELEFVRSHPNENIWTYMDGDEAGTIICAGYHFVNRIGYFITEVAREPELEDMSNHICITVSTNEEYEDDEEEE